MPRGLRPLPNKPMLRSIHAVTYTVPNFDASCGALESNFRYRRVETGRIAEKLASFWGAARLTGSRSVTFLPASAEPVYVRLIEQPPTRGYGALKTYGWNATELHVQDVNALARDLVDSPYRILGGPRDLLGDGTAVALQTKGPSDEVFYLTEINGEAMHRSYGRAETRVGRAFITVLGSKHHDATLSFYGALCEATTEPNEFPIRVLAAAHGLDEFAARFPIASAILQEQFRIEIDGYPDSAITRPVTPGALPPGLCMVSFLVDSLGDLPVRPLRIYPGMRSVPYEGRQTALIQGPDGELLELIASPN